MHTVSKTESVRKDLDRLIQGATSTHQLMSEIVSLLHERVDSYNWVGFYMVERQPDGQPPMLVLGPFRGAPTPHTRIPLNQGICGAAASTGMTVVVDDVAGDPRYLACSIETKSEIVVPIYVKGAVVGE